MATIAERMTAVRRLVAKCAARLDVAFPAGAKRDAENAIGSALFYADKADAGLNGEIYANMAERAAERAKSIVKAELAARR